MVSTQRTVATIRPTYHKRQKSGALAPIIRRNVLTRARSDRFGPAFREGQRRGRERPSLALPRPGPPLGLDAVADQTGAERRDQHGADAVAPVGNLVRLRVDQQRLTDIVPGQRDILAMRLDV